ncbi:hypothetical protein [Sphingomonas sp. 35-24ZXX]|uniref:hypothetical protein n=1 Tax=Sphingomonas sp. 35-24ZXX TaxID=1545915 RepID=UPI000B1E9C5C|nr:hypothetical protein [Sphingomonas sp. 35-24ZXX]
MALSTAEVAARDVVSTAQARWSALGRDFANSSNTISINVSQPAIAVRIFRPASSGVTTLVPSGQCASATPQNGSRGDDQSIPLAATDAILAGERLVLQISAPQMNRDSASIETVWVEMQADGQDSERFGFRETASSSGVFAGVISTQRAERGFTRSDCQLAVNGGQLVQLAILDVAGRQVPAGTVRILVDPFGLVVDSQDGRPVSGARVSLVDASGQPAVVYAADGITPWPSDVVSGQPVTDGSGANYPMQDGEYRFPLVAPGSYRLVVQPPAPFSAPSTMARTHLAGLRRMDGQPLVFTEGSFGRAFEVAGVEPVRIDIPIDRAATQAMLTKSASKSLVHPGELLIYTLLASNPDPSIAMRDVVVRDRARSGLRLRPGSIRVDGLNPPAAAISMDPDGRGFTLRLGRIAPGEARKITYVMRVREEVAAGYAENVATLTDSREMVVRANSSVRVERDVIASRMTIIGRITQGECGGPVREGLAGVQVMMEDGSFAITDADGRYHFEGVLPGTHVVQIARHSLPSGAVPQQCASSVRSAGSAISRFVIGQGGSLAVADFVIRLANSIKPPSTKTAPAVAADALPSPSTALPTMPDQEADAEARARKAAGADTNWLALGDGPDDFLFPLETHNPSAPALRVVIRHRANHKVQLSVQGKALGDLAFDGTTMSADRRYAVSIWRGVPLIDGANLLVARLVETQGAEVRRLERVVNYSGAPISAELIKDRSSLIADGRKRPVIAVRLTDRTGRPARSGLTGQLSINAPYESAAALEALQLSQLSGSGAVAPRWMIEGDDGIALIELAPTMVSGALRLGFVFQDGDVRREQRIDTWMAPGDQPWTLIALAEGAAGAANIAGLMEQIAPEGRGIGRDARFAFYTKGKVLGKFLLTAAYDSAKERAEQQLLGVIDPNSYYTVFGDGSDRRFDAVSRERLYVRIESEGFNALYGDFVTGFDQTDLAAYRRTLTGARVEARDGQWHVEAFAAKTASTQRRDEFQGNGLTGPYRLSTRAIVPNSERIILQVRDRFRSEVIVSQKELIRFVDYDLDLLSATIRFRQPILSRDADLNPRFIVIDYEVDEGQGRSSMNAGIRADYTAFDGALVVGTTAISDSTNGLRGTLVAMDVRAQLGKDTELRGEVAASDMAPERGLSWQVEAEHHSGKLDVLAYARSIAPEFGIGQQNLAEKGRRKFGVDARFALDAVASITASTWLDQSLIDESQRYAAQINAVYRTQKSDWRLGFAHFSDRLSDGSRQESSVAEGAVTRRLLGDRLELELSSSIALGTAGSVDLPERYRIGARYALNSSTRLLASYEIAEGAGLAARTFSGGIELTPWNGARITSTLGQSDISEQGKRTYAAAGLAQNFQITPELGLDVSVDGNRKLGGRAILPINPAQPLASGGQLGDGAGLFEDFTAITFGANWRKDRWSATGRGEWRDGELADRKGLTFGMIRQLGEGSVVGSGFVWTQASGEGAAAGTRSEVIDASLAMAFRPAESSVALLGKLEYRSDMVKGATAGEVGPVGRSALTISGDGRSRRFIGSLSGNWSPRNDEGESGASEIGFFFAARHSLEAVDNYDLAGTSVVAGLDMRQGLGKRVELGFSATVRRSLTDGDASYAIGPSIGFSPAKGTLVTVGYNASGFDDPDFDDVRASRKGLFLVVRAKIDQDSFAFLRRNGA